MCLPHQILIPFLPLYTCSLCSINYLYIYTCCRVLLAESCYLVLFAAFFATFFPLSLSISTLSLLNLNKVVSAQLFCWLCSYMETYIYDLQTTGEDRPLTKIFISFKKEKKKPCLCALFLYFLPTEF